MLKKTSIMVGLAALVMASCGGGSSESKDTSVTESTDRERNTLIGGFGTDGSGVSTVALAKTSSSYYDSLTMKTLSNGDTMMAFHSTGVNEGVSFNDVVQARLLANGSFDTTFGTGGFIKIDLGEHDVTKILFDSHGTILVWQTWLTEVPNSQDAEGNLQYVSNDEIKAFTFGANAANMNYGEKGIISLSGQTFPQGVGDVVIGLRGDSADGLVVERYTDTGADLVSITARGVADTSVKNGGVNSYPTNSNEDYYSRTIDMSLLPKAAANFAAGVLFANRGAQVADCPPDEYCPGPVENLEAVLMPSNEQGAEKRIQTTEVDDLLSYNESGLREVFARPADANTVSAQSARQSVAPKTEPLPLITVIARNKLDESLSRGLLSAGTTPPQWLAVEHFSLDVPEDSTIQPQGASIAPVGSAVASIYYDYETQESGILACASPVFGVCDVSAANKLVYAKQDDSWPSVQNIRVGADGKLHALIIDLTVKGMKTDAVVDLPENGNNSTAETEVFPAALRETSTKNGFMWTPQKYGSMKLGSNNAVLMNGVLTNLKDNSEKEALGIINKSNGGRTAQQIVQPRISLAGGWVNYQSLLHQDATGNEYVTASKDGFGGFVKRLSDNGNLDTQYGNAGYVKTSSISDSDVPCQFHNYQVTDSGQVMSLLMTDEMNKETRRCNQATRKIASIAVVDTSGKMTQSSVVNIPVTENEDVIVSPYTSEFYIVKDSWVPDENENEVNIKTIRRYNSQGVPDTSFGKSGVLTLDEYSPLMNYWLYAADAQGRIVGAGVINADGVVNLQMSRLAREGTLDVGVDAPAPPIPQPQVTRDKGLGVPQSWIDTIQLDSDFVMFQSPLIVQVKPSELDGSMEISWSNAKVASVNVTYTVTASPGGKTCTSTTSSCVVKGLDPWQKYSFVVSAAGVTSSAPTEAIQPFRVVKVGTSTSLKKLLTPANQSALKWSVSGGCKIAKNTTLIAPKKAGSCLLSVKTAKVGKTAATIRSVRIQVVKALPK
ncbi:MAG: hypothetical protein WCG65_02045 [Actinomycetes bacterium]